MNSILPSGTSNPSSAKGPLIPKCGPAGLEWDDADGDFRPSGQFYEVAQLARHGVTHSPSQGPIVQNVVLFRPSGEYFPLPLEAHLHHRIDIFLRSISAGYQLGVLFGLQNARNK